FGEDGPGNFLLHGRECKAAEKFTGLANGERGGLADVLARNAHGARLSPQALPFALGAKRVSAVLGQHDAHVQLVLLALQILEESVDARKAARAFEYEGLLFQRQVKPGDAGGDAVLLRRALEFGEVRAVLGAVPRINGAFVECLRFVGNDEVEVEVDGVAKALAARAGSVGVVEGEQARLRLAI